MQRSTPGRTTRLRESARQVRRPIQRSWRGWIIGGPPDIARSAQQLTCSRRSRGPETRHAVPSTTFQQFFPARVLAERRAGAVQLSGGQRRSRRAYRGVSPLVRGGAAVAAGTSGRDDAVAGDDPDRTASWSRSDGAEPPLAGRCAVRRSHGGYTSGRAAASLVRVAYLRRTCVRHRCGAGARAAWLPRFQRALGHSNLLASSLGRVGADVSLRRHITESLPRSRCGCRPSRSGSSR